VKAQTSKKVGLLAKRLVNTINKQIEKERKSSLNLGIKFNIICEINIFFSKEVKTTIIVNEPFQFLKIII